MIGVMKGDTGSLDYSSRAGMSPQRTSESASCSGHMQPQR